MLQVEVPVKAFDARVMATCLRAARAVARALGVSDPLLGLEVELTRSLGLFDREHYLSQLGPAELKGQSALRHYVEFGDAAGLSPTPMFDVRHYDAHSGPLHGLNRLLHYGLIGRFRKTSTSPWFDAEYYLQVNPDVQQSGQDPLLHFQKWGWREGRNPLPGVDLRRLLHNIPHLRVAKGNPLSQLATGELAQWLTAHPTEMTQAAVPLPFSVEAGEPAMDMLDPASWAAVKPIVRSGEPMVDVVIPVYAGTQETLRCLHSVLTAPVRTPHEVIVINDAGPIAELNAMLRSLAGRDLFTLIQQRSNGGFVKTVNHGLRLHPQRDVVILNSDTEVYGDWLDRLLAMAAASPQLASITPLSNNATICSYPETVRENHTPLEIDHAEIDRLASQCNAGHYVTAPTGVGFCMYMRRTVLNRIGHLDEQHFGRGYGEENDWCQRAIADGHENAIACDVYVRHVGSVSFKGEARERVTQALLMLKQLHPRYEEDVATHIATNPAWIHRARIDLARLRLLAAERNVLLVCHNRGGGTERHLLEQSRELTAGGAAVFELRPSHEPGCVALLHPSVFSLPNLATVPLQPSELLEEMLVTLGIDEIHVHHLIDFPPATTDALVQIAEQANLEIRASVHDYYALCPRINLVTPQGRYCGVPPDARCNACLASDGLIEQVGPIGPWRASAQRLLDAAHSIVVPSDDVAQRLRLLVSGERPISVWPHEPPPTHRPGMMRIAQQGDTVRVLVVGAISRIKGFDVMTALADVIAARQLPMTLALLGYSMDDPALAQRGITLLGRYFDHELLDKIAQHQPHLIFIPSIWPETYCYVLTGALASGYRVAVFDIGAPAQRTPAHDPGHLVLPLALVDEPDSLALRLLREAHAQPVTRAHQPLVS